MLNWPNGWDNQHPMAGPEFYAARTELFGRQQPTSLDTCAPQWRKAIGL
jgi:hypothetical protein